MEIFSMERTEEERAKEATKHPGIKSREERLRDKGEDDIKLTHGAFKERNMPVFLMYQRSTQRKVAPGEYRRIWGRLGQHFKKRRGGRADGG